MNHNKLFDTTKAQSGLLPVILIVVGLVSVAAVVTQINITGFFALNETAEDVSETTSPTDQDTTPEETIPVVPEEILPIEENVSTIEPILEENVNPVTSPEENATQPDTSPPRTNETTVVNDTTPTEENATISQPVENVTQPIGNVTLPIENATANETTPIPIAPPETTPLPIEEKPILNIAIDYPTKITRGEIVNINGTVTNSGADANNVVLTWQLPAGFRIVSGDQEKACGNLISGSSCTSEISVETSLSTELGTNKIKVVVSYE